MSCDSEIEYLNPIRDNRRRTDGQVWFCPSCLSLIPFDQYECYCSYFKHPKEL